VRQDVSRVLVFFSLIFPRSRLDADLAFLMDYLIQPLESEPFFPNLT
jgi:hypothetical protein